MDFGICMSLSILGISLVSKHSWEYPWLETIIDISLDSDNHGKVPYIIKEAIFVMSIPCPWKITILGI